MTTVSHEGSNSSVAQALIRQLTAELAACYPDDPLEGGADFDPKSALAELGSTFVVAWAGGKAVGCGAVRPLVPDVGEVKRMFVLHEERGQGIARGILSALEEFARGFGYERLRLETGVRQLEAIRLYERAGYERIECYGRYVDNPWSICFEKWLETRV